jgi:hypothetical protein
VGLCVITNRIPELGLHQLREISAQMHQFVEISAFDNAALLEDPDHVRIPNGRQAVGRGFRTDGAYLAAGSRWKALLPPGGVCAGGKGGGPGAKAVVGIDCDWENTVIELPGGNWENVFSGERFSGGTQKLSRLLAQFLVFKGTHLIKQSTDISRKIKG